MKIWLVVFLVLLVLLWFLWKPTGHACPVSGGQCQCAQRRAQSLMTRDG